MPEAARPDKGVRDVARQAEDAAVHCRRGRADSLGVDGVRGAVAWAEIDLLRRRRSSGYRRPGGVEAEVVEDPLRDRRLGDEGDELQRRILRRIDRLVKRGDTEDEVFYVDEADIDLNPRIGATYMRRGEQLVVLTPGKNVKRYVAGALNARTGKVVHIVRERKNSNLFVALVEDLCRRYRRARRIHLVLDNFIIHKSKRTLRYLAALGGRVVLHFLPPYSPQSNVIERLWKQLHDHVTRNHTHRSIEPLMEAVDEFIEGTQRFPGTKVSMLAHAA